MKKLLAIASLGMCLASGTVFASNDTINGAVGEVNTTEGTSTTSVGVSTVNIANAEQVWQLLAAFLGY